MNDRKTFVPIDENERELFRTNIGSNFIVEAGAGTGKTTLIIDRVAELIKKFNLGELVAITFTERAAAELAERIYSEIERRIRQGDPNRRELLETLNRFEHFQIGTIHSFALSIVHRFGMEIGLPPDLTHLDNDAEEQLVNSILARSLETPEEIRDYRLNRFADLGGQVGGPAKLAKELYRYRDLLHLLPDEIPPFDIKVAGREIYSMLKELISFAERECEDKSDKLYQNISNWRSEVREHLDEDDIDYIRWLLDFDISSRIDCRVGSQISWTPGGKQGAKDRINAIRQRCLELKKAERGEVLLHLLKWLKADFEKVWNAKQSLGAIGYHDQLMLAGRLLKVPEIAEEIQAKYTQIIIDEFQDTDPLQVEIALAVAGAGDVNEPEKSILKPGRICVVGDRKQSIYRFRRADPATFLAASEFIGRYGRRVSMIQNFRSAKGIIDFCNSVCKPLWADGKGGEGGYEPLKFDPRRPKPQPDPPVAILRPDMSAASDLVKIDQCRQAEAKAVATYLNDLMRRGVKIWDKTSGDTRDAEWDDVALLVSRYTNLDIYLAALDDAGIPYSVLSGKGFFSQRLVAEVSACLTAVDNPADRLKVVAALRSRFFGVSDRELIIWHRRSNGKMDYRAYYAGLPDGIGAALTVLRRMHTIKEHLFADQLIEELFIQSGVVAVMSLRGSLNAERMQMTRLLDLAHRHGRENGRGLRSFRLWLAAKVRDPEEDSGLVMPEESAGGVKLLSIHSAKGLEFPVVGLIDLAGGDPPHRGVDVLAQWRTPAIEVKISGQNDRQFETPGYRQMKKEEKVLEQQERIRLLYVGLTRARDHLFIPLFLPKMKSESTLAAVLDNLLGEPPFSEGGGADLFSRHTFVPDSEEVKSSEIKGAEAPAPSPLELANLINQIAAQRDDFAKTAISSRPTIIRPSQHEVEFQGNYYSALSPANASAGRIGRAVHRYLALCPLKETVSEPLLERCAQIEAAPLEIVGRMCRTTVKSNIWRRIITARRVFREDTIAAVQPEGMVRGAVDALWEEDDGNICLVDWKTGTAYPHHRLQMTTYLKALKNGVKLHPRSGFLFYCETNQTETVLLDSDSA